MDNLLGCTAVLVGTVRASATDVNVGLGGLRRVGVGCCAVGVALWHPARQQAMTSMASAANVRFRAPSDVLLR